MKTHIQIIDITTSEVNSIPFHFDNLLNTRSLLKINITYKGIKKLKS
jgi:hypothetical protein